MAAAVHLDASRYSKRCATRCGGDGARRFLLTAACHDTKRMRPHTAVHAEVLGRLHTHTLQQPKTGAW